MLRRINKQKAKIIIKVKLIVKKAKKIGKKLQSNYLKYNKTLEICKDKSLKVENHKKTIGNIIGNIIAILGSFLW